MDILDEIKGWYSRSVHLYGAVPSSVGWKNHIEQYKRFDKLADVMDRPGRYTVADLGCGYGAFYDYLCNCEGVEISGFFGYDISEDMLKLFEERIDDAKVTLELSTKVTHDVDYAFASGIFHFKMDADQDIWLKHIKKTLNNLNTHATKGFAFNMLSSHVDYQEDHLYYAEPTEWLDYSLREFSGCVTLDHDQGLHEWTIAVKKQH